MRKKGPIQEARIHNEAIADAYGPEERALGWYYYLENELQFPFEARCIAARIVSPLRKGETVQVLRMAPEDACSADMLRVAVIDLPRLGQRLLRVTLLKYRLPHTQKSATIS
jgi:hypothetical protein